MPGPAAAAIPAGKLAGLAWGQRRNLLWLLLALLAVPLALIGLIMALVAGFAGTQAVPGTGVTYAPSPFALRDIPPAYLKTYQAAGSSYGLGWEYLAAIGSIETNHGRSDLPGVKSGTNDAAFANGQGCCAGPMQFLIVGPNGGTWGAYGVDGDSDGDKDVYDPEDAIPAAGNYLKASGAPGDWDKALFAYNHSSAYVSDVKERAAAYRGAPIGPAGLPPGSGESQAIPIGAKWLMAVPGTNAVCDRRIVPDVVLLLERYKMAAGDCFAMSGHTIDGEHPLGLGIDLSPGPGGSWELVGQAARDLGWRSGCGSSGCAGQVPSPFRFIGWNGYQGHGDPAHAGANAHLHLSWQHTPSLPGNPAARVQTLLPAAGAASPAPAAARPPAANTPAPSTRALLNVGDSLAEGTAVPLAGLLDGWRVRTDARTNRPTTEGVKRLRELAADDSLAPVIAVSLGANDNPARSEAFANAIDNVLKIAGADRCVLWFSVQRPPLNGISYDAFNTELARAANEHRNLKILDGAVGQRTPDGVHKTSAGYRDRARLIANAARRCP